MRSCVQGGLQLPMSQLSWPMSVGGLCLTFFAIYVYPAVQRVLGPATSCNLALAAGVPIALILPFASLTSHRWLQQVPCLRLQDLTHLCCLAVSISSCAHSASAALYRMRVLLCLISDVLLQVLLYSGIILGFLFKACCFTSSM